MAATQLAEVASQPEIRGTRYVIKARTSSPAPGCYLQRVESTYSDWTPDLGEAMRFTTAAAANIYWASVPPGLGASFPVTVEAASGN